MFAKVFSLVNKLNVYLFTQIFQGFIKHTIFHDIEKKNTDHHYVVFMVEFIRHLNA